MAQQALIVYYSQFNNTTKLAKLIQDATKAPALRLRVADSVYPNNMEATGRIYQQQLKQRQLPILINSMPQLNQYDVVLVGGPVWNGNVAAPVIEFLKTIQGYQGLIAPFSTAWSDSDDYQANFIKWAGRLQVTDGFHVTTLTALISSKQTIWPPGCANYDKAKMLSPTHQKSTTAFF